VLTNGELFLSHGVSHILAPVFAKPQREWFWEHQAGLSYAREVGTTTVVANSLVIGRLMPEPPEDPRAMALAVSREGEPVIGRADHAMDPALFRLSTEEVVPYTPIEREADE
jgi:hypothetical protein